MVESVMDSDIYELEIMPPDVKREDYNILLRTV
jgi:hypothetical protein